MFAHEVEFFRTDDQIYDIFVLTAVTAFSIEDGRGMVGRHTDFHGHLHRPVRDDEQSLFLIALVEGIQYLRCHELIDDRIKRRLHAEEESGDQQQADIEAHDIIEDTDALFDGHAHGNEIRAALAGTGVEYQRFLIRYAFGQLLDFRRHGGG